MHSGKFFDKINLCLMAFLFYACTVTTSKTKPAVFIKDIKEVSSDIRSLALTENMDFSGREITSNGISRGELTISLINPKEIPADTLDFNDLTRQLATLAKLELQNPEDFNDYKVLFVKKDSSSAKSSWTGRVYKSEDLKNYLFVVSVGDQFDSATFRAIGKKELSRKEPEIVTVFKYYYGMVNEPISLEIFKQTDSGNVLVSTEAQGRIEAGNNFLTVKIQSKIFYDNSLLGPGFYEIGFKVGDSIAEKKPFRIL